MPSPYATNRSYVNNSLSFTIVTYNCACCGNNLPAYQNHVWGTKHYCTSCTQMAFDWLFKVAGKNILNRRIDGEA